MKLYWDDNPYLMSLDLISIFRRTIDNTGSLNYLQG